MGHFLSVHQKSLLLDSDNPTFDAGHVSHDDFTDFTFSHPMHRWRVSINNRHLEMNNASLEPN